jgi:type IV pilus biogenesis protein CpaD/CtpE
MFARRPPRKLVALLALAWALGACGSTTPSTAPTPTAVAIATPGPTVTSTPATAGPSSPPAAIYSAIRTAVEQIRGLQPTAAVEPVTIDEAQLRINLEAEFDSTYTPQQLKDTEDLLAALGLIPKGSSLRTLTLDMEAGQVAGYYSPEKDQLFVVNRTGSIGPVDEATYAHEFTHQLQDQHFDLDKLGLDAADQSDRSLGRLALVEGDATSAQSSWMTANLNAEELGQLLAASLDPKALEALNNAPAYLRETALFPYQDGLGFVSTLIVQGGYSAVDVAFANPPDSTEQILHPEKYVAREKPTVVSLSQPSPAAVGAGWTKAGEDTLGELVIRIWLTEGGVPSAQARTAVAGWGGDRIALYRGQNGATGVFIRTQWDTPTDAAEFALAAKTAIAKLMPGGQVTRPGGFMVDVSSSALVP